MKSGGSGPKIPPQTPTPHDLATGGTFNSIFQVKTARITQIGGSIYPMGGIPYHNLSTGLRVIHNAATYSGMYNWPKGTTCKIIF